MNILQAPGTIIKTIARRLPKSLRLMSVAVEGGGYQTSPLKVGLGIYRMLLTTCLANKFASTSFVWRHAQRDNRLGAA